MKNQQIIDRAVDKCIGQRPDPGKIVAMRNESKCWTLLRYEGNTAIVDVNGVETHWPADEIFDVNAVRRLCMATDFGTGLEAIAAHATN